jgi:hypothetical protein
LEEAVSGSYANLIFFQKEIFLQIVIDKVVLYRVKWP